MKLKEELDEMYEKWLIEEYPDEVKNKDDLIEKLCDGYKYDEFVEKIKTLL
jgi:hypothetical protein